MKGYLIKRNNETIVLWGNNQKWLKMNIDNTVYENEFDCYNEKTIIIDGDNIESVLNQLAKFKKEWDKYEKIFHEYCRTFPQNTYVGAITKIFKDCKIYKF